jgi:small GTP-binding protein
MPNKAFLLTPPGPAAIAVVRLTGDRVANFLQSHFSRQPNVGKCVHGDLHDGTKVIDDPVVVLSNAGQTADLSLHGGVWIVRAVMELAARNGFELIENEYPDEAFDGDTLLEREVAAWLPFARTDLALRTLLAQPEAWKRIAEYPRQEILADQSLFWLLNLPRVAIIGPANVGKSTLANQLFAQERSITADLPGTTRDWIGEIANLDGLAVMLVDTPGLRQTNDEIEQLAIERAAEQVRAADLVIIVLDLSRHLDPEQSAILTQNPTAIVVANKADKPPMWNPSHASAIPTIATRGEGIDTLRATIRQRFGCDSIDITRPRCWGRVTL